MLEPVWYRRRRRGGNVTDVLEGLVLLHVLRHQTMLFGRCMRIARGRALVFVVFIVLVLLAHEVFRALVLVCAAILRDLSARLH